MFFSAFLIKKKTINKVKKILLFSFPILALVVGHRKKIVFEKLIKKIF